MNRKKHPLVRRDKLKPRNEALCRRAVAVIAEYLNDELSAYDRSRFESHLIDCQECAAFFTTYKKTLQAARSLQYDDMPPDLQSRVLQFVREQIRD